MIYIVTKTPATPCIEFDCVGCFMAPNSKCPNKGTASTVCNTNDNTDTINCGLDTLVGQLEVDSGNVKNCSSLDASLSTSVTTRPHRHFTCWSVSWCGSLVQSPSCVVWTSTWKSNVSCVILLTYDSPFTLRQYLHADQLKYLTSVIISLYPFGIFFLCDYIVQL